MALRTQAARLSSFKATAIEAAPQRCDILPDLHFPAGATERPDELSQDSSAPSAP